MHPHSTPMQLQHPHLYASPCPGFFVNLRVTLTPMFFVFCRHKCSYNYHTTDFWMDNSEAHAWILLKLCRTLLIFSMCNLWYSEHNSIYMFMLFPWCLVFFSYYIQSRGSIHCWGRAAVDRISFLMFIFVPPNSMHCWGRAAVDRISSIRI